MDAAHRNTQIQFMLQQLAQCAMQPNLSPSTQNQLALLQGQLRQLSSTLQPYATPNYAQHIMQMYPNVNPFTPSPQPEQKYGPNLLPYATEPSTQLQQFQDPAIAKLVSEQQYQQQFTEPPGLHYLKLSKLERDTWQPWIERFTQEFVSANSPDRFLQQSKSDQFKQLWAFLGKEPSLQDPDILAKVVAGVHEKIAADYRLAFDRSIHGL